MADDPIKLNLGAGDKSAWLDGYQNLDAKDGVEVFPLPAEYAADSVDEIRASHVLEHFGHRQTVDVLTDWVSRLKPGGILKIAVPDFDRIIQMYQQGTGHPIEGYLLGGHSDDRDKHGALFTRQKLQTLLRHVGLVNIKPWQGTPGDCSALAVSLNLQAEKPAAFDASAIGSDVVAIMSTPRTVLSMTEDCLFELRHQLGIDRIRKGGVYWHHGKTIALEEAKAKGFKYALAVDYDTVFATGDVIELYRLMEATPDAGAICAVQMKRGGQHAMFTLEGTPNQISSDDFDVDLMPIRTGHFGLTMIRLSSLDDMPRPWFHETADVDGGWNAKGDGSCTHADVSFWLRMTAKKYQANRVSVGHIQEVVTWPSTSLSPIHQFPNEIGYADRHIIKPDGVMM